MHALAAPHPPPSVPQLLQHLVYLLPILRHTLMTKNISTSLYHLQLYFHFLHLLYQMLEIRRHYRPENDAMEGGVNEYNCIKDCDIVWGG